jgi:hypothetical protein
MCGVVRYGIEIIGRLAAYEIMKSTGTILYQTKYGTVEPGVFKNTLSEFLLQAENI